MRYIEYMKKDYSSLIGKPCVYKIWFNNYYYIGCTSNLEDRINTHMSVIRRISGSQSVDVRSRKVYRKLIKMINKELIVAVDIEILLMDASLERAKEYERLLLYKNHNCPLSINNVKKKF